MVSAKTLLQAHETIVSKLHQHAEQTATILPNPKWYSYVQSAFALILGIFVLFWGYSQWKATRFIISWYMCFLPCAAVILVWGNSFDSFFFTHEQYYLTLVSLIVAIVPGPLLVHFYPRSSVFYSGAAIGYTITAEIAVAAKSTLNPRALVLITIGMGILAGIATVLGKSDRLIVILGVSLAGAQMTETSLLRLATTSGAVFNYFVASPVTYAVLAAIGMAVQTMVTGKNSDHRPKPKNDNGTLKYNGP